MVVYKITNLLNGKIYVGQTTQPIEKRFIQHSYANSPLGQAMRDCGLENFTIEVIEKCESPAQLNEREKFWIKVLNSKKPNGYNLSSGISAKQKIKIKRENIFQGNTVSVYEAAVFLGLSPMTIRRRILEGVLHATLGSKKEGYQITETELLRFSKTLKPKNNSLISGFASVVPFVAGAAIASSVLVGGGIGQFLANIIGGTLSSHKNVRQNVEENDLNDLNNPVILNSIISRLNEEVAHYDLKIKHQTRLLNTADESNKLTEEEKLFHLQDEQFRLKKEIKDLEIRKAIIDNEQKGV